MPIVAWIAGALLTLTGSFVGRVLVSLGIGFISYEGVTTAMDAIKSNVLSLASGLPAVTLGVMATMKVGTCISILLSAVIVRLTLQGLTSSGAIKRMAYGVGDIRRL
jgi:hypothetical protein